MNNLRKNLFNRVLSLLIVLFIFSFQVNAQVTIGSLSEPQGGALLDLKEKEDAGEDKSNSDKGVLFPKVELQSATSLSPLIPSASDLQKKTSKGMIVYNVNKNATKLNEGLCVWNGTEWSTLEGGGLSRQSKIKMNCSGRINVSGNLTKGIALSSYINTITLPVTVLQKGTYNIQAYSNPDNGYYFEANGEFFKEGNVNVTLNGTGTPNESSQTRSGTPDKLEIYLNGELYDAATCPSLSLAELEIASPPAYTFDCDKIDISRALLNMNTSSITAYIDIDLLTPSEAAGSQYHIETNTVDGIKFEGSGYLVAGTQTVRLTANGEKPTKIGTCRFYFISNSTTFQPDCSVEIPVIGRAVNVAIWCDQGNEWDIGSTGSTGGVRKILQSDMLFGLGTYNSFLCPVSAINITSDNSFPSLKDMDIVIISYSAVPTGQNATYLANFVNAGGVVIQCLEGINSRELPEKIFGTTINTGTSNATTSKFSIVLEPGNPFTNGAYMNITGKNLGYDGISNITFTNVENLTNTEVIGRRSSDQEPVIIRHKTKPYILFGDGGPFAGEVNNTGSGSHPLNISTGGLPVVRTGTNYTYGAYNAHFFVNMMIWAINYRLTVAP
jgi:hypothetical protein